MRKLLLSFSEVGLDVTPYAALMNCGTSRVQSLTLTL